MSPSMSALLAYKLAKPLGSTRFLLVGKSLNDEKGEPDESRDKTNSCKNAIKY